MVRHRLFILDRQLGGNWKNLFEATAKYSKKDVEIVLSREGRLEHIPKDFDAYFLHLSETSEEAIKELREEQPWSWIYCRTGAPWRIPSSLRKIFDGSSSEEDICEKIVNRLGTYTKEE